MKNYEKYADEIKEYNGYSFCKDFIIPNILKPEDCGDVGCNRCRMLQMIWLLEEYEEPETDWSKVEVDTPILARDREDEDWYRRYFAECKDGVVYTWVNGRTSWSVYNSSDVTGWKYAKLAEDEKEYKEPEVDWSKVEVDTPILVRDYEDGRWVRRCFAKYENGKVYAWQAGCTSHSIAVHVTEWKYAKLIENEETK